MSSPNDKESHEIATTHELQRDAKDDLEFIWIPPGKFVAGLPWRPLTCDGFYMSRFPVTNRQFHEFVLDSGYASENESTGKLLGHWQGDAPPQQLANHPVVFVSLADALAYCEWSNTILPSEWMWEKAARGTDGREFPWGEHSAYWSPHSWWERKDLKDEEERNNLERLCNVANDQTMPVDAFPDVRSAFGCEDMVGNAAEWTWADPLSEGQVEVSVDPRSLSHANDKAHLCGSCFMRKMRQSIAVYHRRQLSPERRNKWVGFRPALLP